MQENKLMENRAIWGSLLIGAGLLFLLQNFGILGGLATLAWVAIFGAGGMFFLYFFLTNRARAWWAAIPGCTLLGLAAVVFLGEFAPAPLDRLGGALFLGAIGFGFALIYLADRGKWWAVIPAGVMVTLGSVAAVDTIGFGGRGGGGLFFLGLGLTFLLVALLPSNGHSRRWAFIPATVLLIMGVLIGVSAVAAFGVLWPLVLIGVGLVLVWRNLMTKSI